MADETKKLLEGAGLSQRAVMNSASLQARFPEVYRDFFSRCSIVASAPGDFAWTGEYAVFFGALGIFQHLPLRYYVGLEPNSKKGFELGPEVIYNPTKNCFEPSVIPFNERVNLLKLLNQVAQKLGLGKRGFRIHFLKEIPHNSGLNGSGALVADLSLIMHLLAKKLLLGQINSWRGKSLIELLSDPGFNSIFRLTWKFHTVFHTERTSGARSLLPLVSSSLPIVYFTERRGVDIGSRATKIPSILEGKLELIDQIKVWAFRIEELLGYREPPPWPVDLWIYSTGEYKPLILPVKAIDYDIQHWREITLQAREILKPFFDKTEDSDRTPLFFEDIFKQKDELLYNLIFALSSYSLQTLIVFKHVFDSGGSPETLVSFFELLNEFQDCLNLLALSSQSTKSACQTLRMLPRAYSIPSGVAVKTAGGGVGSVLMVTPLQTIRDKMEEITQLLANSLHKPILPQYLSWLDGFSEEGVKVEQFLEEGLFSPFISKGAIQARYLTTQGELSRRLFSIEEFEEIETKADLVLDKLEHKITIKGKELDSREIHSVKETIIVLEKLLDSPTKTISSSALPESSYSLDRNLMAGKIVLPLEKAVKKYFGKSLGLKVKGGLTEFTIELKNQGAAIYLKEKVF